LAAGRTHIVFGEGDSHGKLVFVGEGPGYEEDQQGKPFVGAAGQLLTKIIQAIELTREQVYICNIVKCRPPGNRNPREDEIQACGEFLTAQIRILAPRVIVALGKFAASTLLGEEIAITRARGRLRSYGAIPLMPTFHPAYVLRQYTRENRQAVYDDLLQVKALLDRAAST
jgi:DNA polymerase